MGAHEVELRDAWRHLSGGSHSAALERLLGRYREPHRRYHTTEHVMWVLRHVVEIASTGHPGDTPLDLPAVQLAALYHDAVYDPAATKPAANEIASAALAGACASAFEWSDERADHVEQLVFATADHLAHDVDAAVLLDADLAILGAEPAAYAAYMHGVRHEYHHVPDHLWVVGRAAVLLSFPARSAIYTTTPQQAEAAEASRSSYQQKLTEKGFGLITTELAPLDHFYYAEEYHQQYLAKNPGGYCNHGFCQVAYD